MCFHLSLNRIYYHSDLSHCHPNQMWYISFIILLVLLVPCVTEVDEEDHFCSSLMPLEVNSITLSTGYQFKHENQSIYSSKDLCEFVPRRQWPDIVLPMPAEEPHKPAPEGPSTLLVKAMQDAHDNATTILKSQGIDPCATF